MFGLGAPELLTILGIVVILFGAKRLPQLGSGVGKGIRNFKKGLNSDDEEDKNIEAPENNDKNA
jgi:sec-independent protein translocase protein TatA